MKKSGRIIVGNYCHAPLIFDTAAKQLSVQSSYTALWHFSHFITPGSRRILTSSFSSEVEKTAFLRSDDTFVLVLQNRGKAKTICVELGGEIAELELPEKALATILIEAASPIA